MRKAKEQAQQYIDNPTLETMQKIAQEYIRDTGELIKARSCTSNAASRAVIRELDQKWKAFARLANVNPDGYKIALRQVLPDVFKAWLGLDA